MTTVLLRSLVFARDRSRCCRPGHHEHRVGQRRTHDVVGERVVARPRVTQLAKRMVVHREVVVNVVPLPAIDLNRRRRHARSRRRRCRCPEIVLFATSLRSPLSRTPKAPESSSSARRQHRHLVVVPDRVPDDRVVRRPGVDVHARDVAGDQLASTRLNVAPAASLMPAQEQLFAWICVTMMREP